MPQPVRPTLNIMKINANVLIRNTLYCTVMGLLLVTVGVSLWYVYNDTDTTRELQLDEAPKYILFDNASTLHNLSIWFCDDVEIELYCKVGHSKLWVSLGSYGFSGECGARFKPFKEKLHIPDQSVLCFKKHKGSTALLKYE